MDDPNRTGFRISPQAGIPRSGPGEEVSPSSPFSGPGLVFAIPRDPRTLFVYWNIDWGSSFAANEPQEHRVYLRTIDGDGSIESEYEVEPLLGTFYAAVKKSRATYRAELGYYLSPNAWKSVGTSDIVSMPADGPSEATTVDVATVPFHLSFQKLVDLFFDSNGGDPLAVTVAHVQERAVTMEPDRLSPNERAALRAMNFSIEDLRAARRFFNARSDEAGLRRRAEAILGFGATSPSGGFGGSSSPGGSSWS